jgi:alkylation response protein AidB-like acyl-CoA dehydrogenase
MAAVRAAMWLSRTDEHIALAETIAGVAQRAGWREETRARHDRPSASALPSSWADLAKADLLAIAFDGDVMDVAVVACELGRSLAPGPAITTLTAAVLARHFGDPALRSRVETGLREGSFSASVWRQGQLVGAAESAFALLPDGEGWRLTESAGLSGSRSTSGGMDPSRSVATLDRVSAVASSGAEAEGRLPGVTDTVVDRLLTLLLAAEVCGIAAWCVETAVDYACVREQFGQPIGAFQAVKHRCADLYCETELALAATWDAAAATSAALTSVGTERPDDGEVDLAVAVATATATGAAVTAAKGLIQILGGIGFTWEHDAHLYFKRALATRQLLGNPDAWAVRAARLAVAGVRRAPRVDLGDVADHARAEVRDFVTSLTTADVADQRRRIVDAGYLNPHWPRPHGRDATAGEQLVIDEEFARAGVARPDLVIGNWAVSTILAHGSDAQRDRFVRPTLLGEITWCQMFSEPGAGSDLASLTTKAVRVDGGWALSGQKVWTSQARTADWAICLARTGSGSRRHDGITYFLVDMTTPGLDIRPLRELTGDALFNEVFLTDVFVPDACVVGDVDGGWRLARATLANERVSMSSGAAFPSGIEDVLQTLRLGGAEDGAIASRVGDLVCRAQAEAMLGLRATLAQLSGTDPGAAASVRKLVGMHLRQEAAQLSLDLLGPDAVDLEDDASRQAWHRTLATRALTIAGGTSEVLHNVIGERILGLPR